MKINPVNTNLSKINYSKKNVNNYQQQALNFKQGRMVTKVCGVSGLITAIAGIVGTGSSMIIPGILYTIGITTIGYLTDRNCENTKNKKEKL